MTENDPPDRRQPQATAGELRREEGVEDLGQGVRVHARTAVGDLDVDVAPLRRPAPSTATVEDRSIALVTSLRLLVFRDGAPRWIARHRSGRR